MRDVIRKCRRPLGVVLGAVSLLVVMSLPALATPVDPTGGEASSMFSDITSFATGILLPAAAGLLLIGIAFRVAVKWVRRGASS